MNLYFRLFKVIILNLFAQKQADIYAICKDQFRCWPLDMDINLHMNNGRYLTIMDLGRFSIMMKLGLFWMSVRRGWLPVVASVSIDFKKSLGPFQKYNLETRLKSMDDKWFYFEQVFKVKDVVYAIGTVKAALVYRKKVLSPQYVLQSWEQSR